MASPYDPDVAIRIAQLTQKTEATMRNTHRLIRSAQDVLAIALESLARAEFHLHNPPDFQTERKVNRDTPDQP